MLKNLRTTPDGELVYIDWTGAGCGPRVASLAFLVWAVSVEETGWSPRWVEAILAGYRAHIALEDREIARFAAAMRLRPLVFACWRFRHAVLAGRAPNGSEWWWPDDEVLRAVAPHACAILQTST